MFIIKLILGITLITSNIAFASSTEHRALTGIYTGADKSVAVVKLRRIEEGTLFEEDKYALEIEIESEKDDFYSYIGQFKYDDNEGTYSIETDVECDDPGCYYYTSIIMSLDPEKKEINISFEGFQSFFARLYAIFYAFGLMQGNLFLHIGII